MPLFKLNNIDAITAKVAMKNSLNAVFMGDSLTQTRRYPTTFCMQTKQRVRLVKNSGIGGDTTADMVARFSTDVIAYSPDICFIMGGVNNIVNSPFDTYPFANTIADMVSMVETCIENGIYPVVLATAPCSTSAALTKAMASYNFILAHEMSNRGVLFLSAWEDFIKRTDGAWATGTNEDDLHPTYPTSAAFSYELGNQFVTKSERTSPFGIFANATTENAFANGFFAVDTNADGRADGVSPYSFDAGVVAATTWSIVDNPIGIGRAQKMVVLNGPYNVTGGINLASTTFVGGHEYEISFDLKTESFTNTHVTASVRIETPTTTEDFMYDKQGDVSGPFTFRVTLAPTATALKLYITMRSKDTTNPYSGTVTIGRLGIVDLTALGLD